MRASALLLFTCVALVGCGRLRFEDLGALAGDDAGGQPGDGGGADAEADPPDAEAQDAVDAEALDADPGDAADADADLLDGDVIADSGLDASDSDAATDASPDTALADATQDSAAGDAQPDSGPPRECGPGLTGDACDQCVRYVDRSSTATSPDGRTWQSAFKTILEGESAAYGVVTGGGPASCQVWVREGRYFIYVDHPINGVALTPFGPLYGGFAGTESQLSQRNLAAHTTIIDGASPDGSQHVLNPVYASSGGYLDGFTITGARNTELNSNFANGGGVDVSGGTTVMRNMTFIDNSCVGNGAGVYAQGTNLTIEDSRFVNNRADGSGAAIALGPNVTGLTLRNVVFATNVAGGDGGAVYVASTASGGLPISFVNLALAQNTAGGRGGAFYMTGVQGSITAVSSGSNTAGATASGALLSCIGLCTLQNVIFWNPSPLNDLSVSGTTAVLTSTVRGGVTGLSLNLITADPQFVSAADLHLRATSPAIDTADGCAGPELDLDGQPRMDVPSVSNNGFVPSDMGAYEYPLGGTRVGDFSVVCP